MTSSGNDIPSSGLRQAEAPGSGSAGDAAPGHSPTQKPARQARRRREYVACAVGDVPVGGRRIVEVAGRSLGIFNVEGTLYALHNGCPHKGGPLCEGRITGTTLPADDYSFVYGRQGDIIRCAWHGWEFEIATGRALADSRVRARSYPVTVDGGYVVVTL